MFYVNLYRKQETMYTEDFQLKQFDATTLVKEESDCLGGPLNDNKVVIKKNWRISKVPAKMVSLVIF